MLPKSTPVRSNALRQSARGEDCTLRLPGICTYDPDTVVLCHLPFSGHGMGRKVDDYVSAYGCHACHDAIDHRRPSDLPAHELIYAMASAMAETQRRMIDRGLIRIQGVKK